MGTYEKSKVTKQAVIDACKKLFFEKGYTNTHYNDIVKESNVSSGLIHYHFKQKRNIAGIIYREFLIHNKNFIYDLLSEQYDLQISTAVEIRNYLTLFLSDENLIRFYYEISLERIIMDYAKDTGEQFFKLHRDEYNFTISDEQIKAINISAVALEVENVLALIEGYINFTINDICELVIKTVYQFMSVDYERIKQIITISNDIYSNMNIRMNKYFSLELIGEKQ